MAGPPPGFVIDDPQNSPNPAQADPGGPIPAQGGPPPGFVVDQPQQAGPVSRFAKNYGSSLWQNINPVEGIKSLANAIGHPNETIRNIGSQVMGGLENAAERYGEGDTVGAAARLVGAVPLVGPQLEKARAGYEAGDYAGASGQLAGLGTALMAPLAIKDVPILPGSKGGSMFMARKSLGMRGIPTAEETKAVGGMLDNGISVGPDSLDKIRSIVDEEEGVQQGIIGEDPTRRVSVSPALRNIEKEAARTKTSFQEPEAVAPVERLKENLSNRASTVEEPDTLPQPIDEGISQRLQSLEQAHNSAVEDLAEATRAVQEMPDTPFDYSPRAMPQRPGMGMEQPPTESGAATGLRAEADRLRAEADRLKSARLQFREAGPGDTGVVPEPGGTLPFDSSMGGEQAALRRQAIAERAAAQAERRANAADMETQMSPDEATSSRAQALQRQATALAVEKKIRGQLESLKAGIPEPPEAPLPDEIGPSMSASEMFTLKKGMHREIKDAAWGQQGSPKIEGLKGERSGFNESLYKEFPELGPSNRREGGVLALEPFMEKAMKKTPPSLLGLDSPSLAAAFAFVRHSPTVGGALLGASVVRRLLKNPAVTSRMAIALSGASKISIPEAYAKIGAYADTLANAETQNGNQATQVRYGTTPDGRRVSQGPDGSIQYSDQPQ